MIGINRESLIGMDSELSGQSVILIYKGLSGHNIISSSRQVSVQSTIEKIYGSITYLLIYSMEQSPS